tara:strand:- start:196 stop:330 length:135 start_codon:yes stop_codon:yes gene_type:complete
MPVYLRRFYVNTLMDEKKREKEAMDKSTNKKINDPGKINPFQSK